MAAFFTPSSWAAPTQASHLFKGALGPRPALPGAHSDRDCKSDYPGGCVSELDIRPGEDVPVIRKSGLWRSDHSGGSVN